MDELSRLRIRKEITNKVKKMGYNPKEIQDFDSTLDIYFDMAETKADIETTLSIGRYLPENKGILVEMLEDTKSGMATFIEDMLI